jgi:hypothetical protein
VPGASSNLDGRDTPTALIHMQNENSGTGQTLGLRFRGIIRLDVDLSTRDQFLINQDWLSRVD